MSTHKERKAKLERLTYLNVSAIDEKVKSKKYIKNPMDDEEIKRLQEDFEKNKGITICKPSKKRRV